MASARIGQLAATISENVHQIEEYLEVNGIPQPSFAVDAPKNLGIPPTAKNIYQARQSAIGAILDLHDLLIGSSALLRPNINGTGLQFVYRYRIPFKVPLHDAISFAELAEKCELPEPDVRRILRFVMATHRVFCEPKEGFVAHTAASQLLLEDDREWDMAGLIYDEDWPAFTKTIDAMQRWGDSDPNHTGHNIAFNTDKNLYDWLKVHPTESQRFNNAISLFAAPGPSLAHLASVIPWSALPPKTTIVDVGGGDGSTSTFLAKEFEQLHFVVQDLPDAIAGQSDKLSDSLKDRMSFVRHDFFTEQPTTAAVYIFRAILHNWPDHYCHRILRQLRTALRKGSKILIQDGIVQEYGSLSLAAERNVRGYDMLMRTLFNGRERDENEWRLLCHEADPRFKVVEIYKPDVGSLGVIELEWQG